MTITKEYLEKLGCVPNGDGYVLAVGAARIALRIYGERCYCELPGLYVGEITLERLHCLYFGLCGQLLKNRLSPEDQALYDMGRNVGNYGKS